MPRELVTKSESSVWTGAPNPSSYRFKNFALTGYRNKPQWPLVLSENDLDLQVGEISPRIPTIQDDAVGSVWGPDVVNSRAYELMMLRPWDERLYASVYARFAEAARQGSAEWGMNIVQGRKALGTFVQLAVTSAASITALRRLHRKAWDYLTVNPSLTPRQVARRRSEAVRNTFRARTEKERVVHQNLVWTLDQISGLLLAFRYGVSPLMNDLYSTMSILSGEMKDNVHLRKAGVRTWGGSYLSAWGPEKVEGSESVVLKATVRVSNPNLALLNRLGLVNPQMWLWDATPWSFVVDWWVGVGSFLNSFTASVGLSFDGGSVTRTRTFTSHLDRYKPWYLHGPESYTIVGKRKVRRTGALPVPVSVPYGTGLGIQRGQNALALIAQQFTKR